MGLDNPLHIAFLLIILLLVFGAKRLPEMGRSLGEGLRGFKDAIGGEGTSHLFGEHDHPASTTATPVVAQPVVAQPPVAQTHTPAIAPAPVVAAPVVGDTTAASVETDPQLVAAARTLGAQKQRG